MHKGYNRIEYLIYRINTVYSRKKRNLIYYSLLVGKTCLVALNCPFTITYTIKFFNPLKQF